MLIFLAAVTEILESKYNEPGKVDGNKSEGNSSVEEEVYEQNKGADEKFEDESQSEDNSPSIDSSSPYFYLAANGSICKESSTSRAFKAYSMTADDIQKERDAQRLQLERIGLLLQEQDLKRKLKEVTNEESNNLDDNQEDHNDNDSDNDNENEKDSPANTLLGEQLQLYGI